LLQHIVCIGAIGEQGHDVRVQPALVVQELAQERLPFRVLRRQAAMLVIALAHVRYERQRVGLTEKLTTGLKLENYFATPAMNCATGEPRPVRARSLRKV